MFIYWRGKRQPVNYSAPPVPLVSVIPGTVVKTKIVRARVAASWHLWPLMETQLWGGGGGGELVALLTCPSEPSRLFLVLINGAVCRALHNVPHSGLSLFAGSRWPPLGPLALLRLSCLMGSTSFIFISKQVAWQDWPTFRWPLRTVLLLQAADFCSVSSAGGGRERPPGMSALKQHLNGSFSSWNDVYVAALPVYSLLLLLLSPQYAAQRGGGRMIGALPYTRLKWWLVKMQQQFITGQHFKLVIKFSTHSGFFFLAARLWI